MNTMSDYTIYCTEEQTRKAFELGAPIENTRLIFEEWCGDSPTAEQMIGWLEEQEKIVSIEIYELEGYWHGYITTANHKDCIYKHDYSSRKEATLAAIDAALEYLTNNNK